MGVPLEDLDIARAVAYPRRRTNELVVWLLVILSVSPLIGSAVKASLYVLMALVVSGGRRREKWMLPVVTVLLSLFLVGAVYDLFGGYRLSELSPLNVLFPLVFLLGFLVAGRIHYVDYLLIAEKLIFLVAVFALVGVLFVAVLPSAVSALPSYSYYGTSHKTAVLFNVLLTEGGAPLQRATGIASEPGVLQMLLNIGLYVHLRYQTFNFMKFSVYVSGVFLTFSTVGLLILAVLVAYALVRSRAALVMVPVLVYGFRGILGEQLAYQATYKLAGSNAFVSREDALRETIAVSTGRFLGLGNSGYNAALGDFSASWDSYGQILVRYGYPLLAVIVGMLVILVVRAPILGVVLVCTFVSQGIWHMAFVVPFYFYAVSEYPFTEKSGDGISLLPDPG